MDFDMVLNGKNGLQKQYTHGAAVSSLVYDVRFCYIFLFFSIYFFLIYTFLLCTFFLHDPTRKREINIINNKN